MDVFLKNKQFRQIAFANLFSMIGDKMFYLAMLTYVSTLPHAQLAIGLVTASELIPQMLSSYTGYRADMTRYRGQYIIISDFIRVTLYLLVGILFVSHLSGWMILIGIALLNFISDFFGTFASGLRQPLIVSVTGKEDFAEASGFTQGMSQIISVLAQFVGASLLIVLAYSQLSFLNAVTFLISGCIMISFFYKNRDLTTK